MKNFKEEKAFKKADIIVYLVVAAIIAAIFLAVFLPRKEEKMTSADIYYGEKIIYCYSFDRKKGEITADGKGLVTVEEGETLLVTVTTDKGKNVVEIGDGYIKMKDADCSGHPDCVQKFSALTAGGGVIVCLPHSLRIVSRGGLPAEVKV